MLESGHIKLHRSILSWEWYDDVNVWRVFTHLLLTANWKDAKWHGMDVLRGQKITSIAKLSEETRLSVRQVRVAMDKLKLTGELTIKTSNKFTIVTVNKYNEYQGNDKQTGKPEAIKRQSNDNQMTTIEESKKAIRQEELTTATAAREGQLKRLFRFYEENGFGALPRYMQDEFVWALDDGFSADLIERCMKEAVVCGKQNWKYTKGILERCKAKGIQTPEQFDAAGKKKQAESVGLDRDPETGIKFAN